MENRKKIVVLDGYTLCAGELNFDALREFGEVTVYDRVAQADVAARIGDAQIVLTNKALITAEVMDACPRMEYVGVTATGYNVVDYKYAQEKGIPVVNVPAYGTASVSQYSIALLLEICHHIGHHSASVHAGEPGFLLFYRADGGNRREDDRPDRLWAHWPERRANRAGFRDAGARLRAASQGRVGRRALCDA